MRFLIVSLILSLSSVGAMATPSYKLTAARSFKIYAASTLTFSKGMLTEDIFTRDPLCEVQLERRASELDFDAIFEGESFVLGLGHSNDWGDVLLLNYSNNVYIPHSGGKKKFEKIKAVQCYNVKTVDDIRWALGKFFSIK